MPDLPLLFATLLAVQAPVADGPAIAPSTPAETAAAVLDCWRSVGPAAVDRKKLAAFGWIAVADPAEASSLTPFVKNGANALIMLADQPEANMMCTVISRVAEPGQEATVLTAVRQLLQGVNPDIKLGPEGETAVLVSLPRVALLDRMVLDRGVNQTPGMRIIVDYKIAEKK